MRSSQPKPDPRWRLLTTQATAAATVVTGVALIAATTPGYAERLAPAWWTALTGVAAFIVASLQRRDGQAHLALTLTAGLMILWSSSGVLFDAGRALAVAGVPGFPPELDLPGALRRLISAICLVTLVISTVALTPASNRTGHRQMWAIAAAVACIPYPVLKTYWWAGGAWARANFASGPQEGFPGLAIAAFAIAATVALALGSQRVGVSRLGRRLRWTAALVCALTLPTGALALMGTAATAANIIPASTQTVDPWPILLVYGSWTVMGVCFFNLALACTTALTMRAREPVTRP